MIKTKVALAIVTALAASIALPTFNNDHSIDFGNTSDLISSVCNVVMASAAVFAALSASTWFKQKHRSTAYDYVVKIMTDYLETILNLNRFYFYMIVMNPKHGDFDNCKNRIHEFTNSVLSLKSRLEACSWFNVSPSTEIVSCVSDMVDFCNCCLSIYMNLITDDNKLIDNKTKLDALRVSILSFNDSQKKEITEIFTF